MIIRDTKLHPPAERGPWVARPRLLHRLRGSGDASLTLVGAPAGFGKTVLMAQWSRRLAEQGEASAWLSLDFQDNDENVFVAHLEAALRPWLASRGVLVETLRSSPILLIDAVVAEICQMTAALAQPLTLFLDDLHLIENPAVIGIVERLVLDGRMHLVIATRTVPPMSLARLRLSGRLVEIGVEELRFDRGDADLFLTNRLGAGLAPDLLDLMVSKTEGWAAGLQLATLQLAAGETLAGFSGGGREVTEFLMQEVFGVLDAGLQDFLMQTSVLERFSAESCVTILRLAEAETMIAAVEARQLFIVRLDNEGRWYRYHHLFRDFLRRQFEKRNPAAIAPLHLAAAEWYLREEVAAEAVCHTLAAGDDRRAAAIVERCALPMIADCRFRDIEELLAQLPRRIVNERIRLQFAIIWISVHSSQTRRATAALARAYTLLEADPDRAGDSGTLPPTSIANELAVLDAAVASTCERFEEARDKARAALKALPVSAWFLRAVAYNIIGCNDYALGDMQAARSAVTAALAAHHRSGSILGLVLCNCYLAAIERSAGRPDLARDVLNAAIAAASEQLGPGSYGEALAKTMLMDIAYETGDIAEALRLLEDIRPLIEGAVVILSPIVSVPAYARLLHHHGRGEDALAILADVEATADRIYLRLAAVILHERVRLLLSAGRIAEARSCIDRFRIERGDAAPAIILEFAVLAEARILLAEKRLAEARVLLERLIPPLRAGERSRRLMVALLLFARCCTGSESRTALAQALRIAWRGRFQRLLLDEGPNLAASLAPALSDLAAEDPAIAEFARQLLAALEAEGAGLPATAKGPADSLTPREIEVLTRLCAGASNRNLADDMALSEPTVKWHLKNIFGKLGVSNRVQAVRKAQEVGLVE